MPITICNVLPSSLSGYIQEKDSGFLVRDHETYDDILVRTPLETREGSSWNDVNELLDPKMAKRNYKLTYRSDIQKNVSELPEAQAVLQMDLVLLPAPVKEKGERGYFPFALLLADKKRGGGARNTDTYPCTGSSFDV